MSNPIPTDPTSGRPHIPIETTRPSVSVDSIIDAAMSQLSNGIPTMIEPQDHNR
jgi:hypothetical protein